MKKTKTEDRDTRQLIMQTAIDLFASNEYSKCTMRELASRVGIKTASLYYHFQSKDDLINELFNYFFINDHKYRVSVSDVVNEVFDKSDEKILERMFVPFIGVGDFQTMNKIVRIALRHQYENEKAGEVSNRIFNEVFMQPKMDLFAGLISRGVFEPFDYKTLSYTMTSYAVMHIITGMNQGLPFDDYIEVYQNGLQQLIKMLAPVLREKRIAI